MNTFYKWMVLLLLCCLPGWVMADAVDIEVTDGEGAVYILFDDGEILFSGSAKNLGFPARVDAVDFTLTPSGNGYYVVEEDGTVHSFGDAVVFGTSINTRINIVDMELSGAGGFYFLRENGTIVTVGDAKLYGFLEEDNAVDLEVSRDGGGYTVLYDDGSMAYFGSAVNYGAVTFRTDHAVDLELVDNGYYVLIDDGTVLNFGNALPLPSTNNSTRDLRALALTNRGYRTLDEEGNSASFLRLDNQGSISWFAQTNAIEPQQVPTSTPTPLPVTPTPTPRPTATPRANVPILDLQSNGFTARVIAAFPSTAKIPASINTGQVSLTSGDTFVVVAASEDEPPRSIRLYRHQEFGSTNNQGAAFASLNEQRGAAVIKGISYSRLGLIVTVEDAGGTQLILIEGQFDDSSIFGFSEY